MISDFERGLLVAFLRLNLTDAQQEIMSTFYPEIVAICGFKPVLKHGIPVALFDALHNLAIVEQKRIQAIKELRTWAIESGGKNGEGIANHPLGTVRGAKDFIDQYFPPVAMPGQS